MADTTKTFGINVGGNAAEAGKAAAVSLQDVRAAAATAASTLASLQSQFKSLKGGGDELAAATASVKKQIEAEEKLLGKLESTAMKAGTSLAALSKEHLAEAAAAQKAGDAEKKKLDEAAKGASALKDQMGAAFESIAAGAAAMGVAILAAFAASAIAFGKFLIDSANVARAMQLTREAAVGSAEGATALGTQVDALARKLPTAKAELNDLASEMARAGLGGQTLVDAFNAVGQAAAANGQSAGNQIRALLERGKVTQRFSLGRFELQGTGLAQADVAAELAKKMKIGIGDAQRALAEGRVSLSAGAEAMRAAVEAKFGGINARKMLDLNVILAKTKERLQGLAAGINLEPLAKVFGEIAELLDTSTVSGAALKEVFTTIGNGIVAGFAAAGPFLKGFFKGLVITALEIEVAYYKVKIALKSAFGSPSFLKDIDGMQTGILAAKIAVGALAASLIIAGAVVAAVGLTIAFPFILAGAAIGALVFIGKKVYDFFKETDFGKLGTDIIDGLVGGIKSGFGRVKTAVTDLGSGAKDAFKNALGIRSPSKVFAEYGRHTTEGYAQGVDEGSGRATSAVASMVDVPSAPRAAPAGGSTNITVNFNMAGGNATELASKLTEASFFERLEEAVRKAARHEVATVEVP